jgi:tripartite-type tricarboxylate transporter receptor subunit TctC
MTGTKMQHIPYKGSSAAHPDLMAGRTMMIFDTVSAIKQHVESGAVRGIAVTTLERSPAVPDLPSISEAALKGYDATTWGGILAPAGTPKDVIARLNTAINAALKMDDVKEKLTKVGVQIQGGTPEHFGKVIQHEVDKWAKLVKEAGIQPE